MKKVRKIVFLTGTRADFGKIKSVLLKLQASEQFELHIFITGMHMLKKYGATHEEVTSYKFVNTHKFINQNHYDSMDSILAKTVSGFSDFIKETEPDIIVVHGDRVEALAGAIVGSLNNICVCHIEGGEVSGTVDELIRHAVSKLSHFHFASNLDAQRRLKQLGEEESSIFIVGSPDIDIMISKDLPTISEVLQRYEIPFDEYGILLFHAVTTEVEQFFKISHDLVDAIIESEKNYVVIFPNNDKGSDFVLDAYKKFKSYPERIRVFPSVRFEYFLTLLKFSQFMIGNSSSGIREAPYYGVPSINIGTRQSGRSQSEYITNSSYKKEEILDKISTIHLCKYEPQMEYGSGDSADKIFETLRRDFIWDRTTQKYFVDLVEK